MSFTDIDDRSGIGRELVLNILARGDEVIATARGRSFSKLSDLQERGAYIYELDVTTSQDNLHQFAEKIIAEHGRVDVLVNNAGKLQVAYLRLFFMFHTHSVVLSRLLLGYVEVTTQESSTSVPISILHF